MSFYGILEYVLRHTFKKMEVIMTNVLWKPGKYISPLWNELFQDDLFKFNDARAQSTLPAVNIREKEEGWYLDLAIPGIPKEKIKIHLEGALLTISAEQQESKTDEKYQTKEFGYISFVRSFTLPQNVQKDQIKAKQEDGILSIFLPKQAVVKTEKLISIE